MGKTTIQALTPSELSASHKLFNECMRNHLAATGVIPTANQMTAHIQNRINTPLASSAPIVTNSFTIDSDIIDDYTVAKKLIQLKSSASSRGIEFNLSLKKVSQLLKKKTCHYTGKKFVSQAVAPNGPFSRTVDRVDNDRGYVDDNVVACTKEFNSMKTNMTVKQIMQMSEGITKHLHPKKRKKANVKGEAIIIKMVNS